MEQQDINIEQHLHTLGRLPVPGSLLQNVQARLGQLTPEWAIRQYQLGYESRNLLEGDRGKQLTMAIAHFHNALHVYTSAAFPLERVQVLYELGETYHDLSQLPKKDRLANLEAAGTCYQEALQVVREYHLADIWLDRLDYTMRNNYQQRIEELKHRADIAKMNGGIHVLHHQPDAALDAYQQALRLYRLVESRLDEAIVLQAIGDVERALQHMDAAMEYYEQAHILFKQMEHRHDVATVLQAMGDVERSRHQETRAEQFYTEALDLFRQVGDRFNEASVLATMGKEAVLYKQVAEAHVPSPPEKAATWLPPSLSVSLEKLDAADTMPGQNHEVSQRAPLPPDDRETHERAHFVAHTDSSFSPGRENRQRKRYVWLSGLLAMILLVIIGSRLIQVMPPSASSLLSVSQCPTAPASLSPSAHGIGVIKTASGDCIGISDGSFAFDVAPPRTDGVLKEQAAAKLRANDRSGAMKLWEQATRQDSSDAEALIYLEDAQVLEAGRPYITLVVGTKITGAQIDVEGERSILQGAYLAQHAYNLQCRAPQCQLVYLLIANSGNDAQNAAVVAKQIVQAASYNHTIIGVEGWSTSQDSLNVVSALTAAQLPMVASAASSDILTNISPYFFRVAPPDQYQSKLAADYIQKSLHSQRVALFVDTSNAYSASLARSFMQDMPAQYIVVKETYTVGTYAQNNALVHTALQDVSSYHPDLIYFAGYSRDAITLLNELQKEPLLARLPVMGGDDLYNILGDGSQHVAGLDRLIFTAFASPDEWQYFRLSAQKPSFFQDYTQTFARKSVASDQTYGDGIPNGEAILSYDALRVLLHASQSAFAARQAPLTGQDLQQALRHITGKQALQEVSGRIAFGQDGDPQDKAVVLLNVDKQGRVNLISTQGQFE
ncbi:MAG TPA: tetratricopeptide repeat protein [Ktedonobacteraceae bacterium]|nr:tetratricopeptide repeat protein [Ktedonobacteraceae bacterium]